MYDRRKVHESMMGHALSPKIGRIYSGRGFFSNVGKFLKEKALPVIKEVGINALKTGVASLLDKNNTGSIGDQLKTALKTSAKGAVSDSKDALRKAILQT